MAYRDKEEAKRKQAVYREANKSELYKKAQAYRLQLKKKVLNHYGKFCAKCNFSDYRALHIDHIHDNGASERMNIGGKNFSGYRFYKWLIDNDYPAGYQTLCANCNGIKQWDLTHIEE